MLCARIGFAVKDLLTNSLYPTIWIFLFLIFFKDAVSWLGIKSFIIKFYFRIECLISVIQVLPTKPPLNSLDQDDVCYFFSDILGSPIGMVMLLPVFVWAFTGLLIAFLAFMSNVLLTFKIWFYLFAWRFLLPFLQSSILLFFLISSVLLNNHEGGSSYVEDSVGKQINIRISPLMKGGGKENNKNDVLFWH